MDLDVRHLRLVVAIAEHRSLTRASEVLHLTQSALSHQLRDIEERLGTLLFLRLNKRMAPTPAGERLLTTARAVLAELTGAETAIRGGLKDAPVPLRLSTEWLSIIRDDPRVPLPLLPQGWPAVAAQQLFRELHGRALPDAEALARTLFETI